MMLGKVIGEVWASRRHLLFEGRKAMLVAALFQDGEKLSPTGEIVVALDDIGAQPGHVVTVSWGSGARAVFQPPDNREILADAAISRIVDAQSQETDGCEVVIVEE
jgi:ethanolamine utilization protein EutN